MPESRFVNRSAVILESSPPARSFMHQQHLQFIIRLGRTALTCGALCGLVACAAPATLALGGASVVTFTQTGRTLSDHAMSLATDQDCSIRNSLAGKSWCQPSTQSADMRPTITSDLHCYRSIAAVTCYRQENPHDTTTRRTTGHTSKQDAEIAGKSDAAAN